MKVPSIFRLPRHQRFEIQPRYYDPVKEDIDKRTSRIRQQLNYEKAGNKTESIREAYARGRKSNKSADLFQLLMVAIISVALGGYIFYGADIVYTLLLLVPLYILLRRKKR